MSKRQEQAKAAQVNGTNQQTIDNVHQTGQDIAGHRDTFEKGMEAQANSADINTSVSYTHLKDWSITCYCNISIV